MPLKHSTRVKMEKYIYDVFNRLDPTKTNTDFYHAFFTKMSDKEFDSFFKNFFADPNAFLTLTVKTFENDLSMEQVESAAKFMGVPLYEYVVQPYFSKDKDKPLTTAYPVPVGYMHEKRVQQTAFKKNSSSIDITQRDAKTNQVVGGDKNGRQSIDETYALLTYGATEAIKEFMSFRADDNVMKEEAYRRLRQDGYVDMNDLPDNVENKATLNMVDAYFICMGVKTDLVTEGMMLVKTLK